MAQNCCAAMNSFRMNETKDIRTNPTSSPLLLNTIKHGEQHRDLSLSVSSVDGLNFCNYSYITQTIIQHENKMGYFRVQRDSIERSVRKALMLCVSPGDIQFIAISRRIGGISYFCFQSHLGQEYLIFRDFASRNIYLLGISPEMQWHSAEGYVKTARVYVELGVFDSQSLFPHHAECCFSSSYTNSNLKNFCAVDPPFPLSQVSSSSSPTAATTTLYSLGSVAADNKIPLKSPQNAQAFLMRSPRLSKFSSLITKPYNFLQDISISSKANSQYTQDVAFYGMQQYIESLKRSNHVNSRYYFVQQANWNCENMFKRAIKLVLPDGPLQDLPYICRPVAVKLMNYQSVAIFPLRRGDLRNLLNRDDCEVYREYLKNNPIKTIEFLVQICFVVKQLHQCAVNLNAFLSNRKSCKLHGLVHTDLKLENFLFDPIPVVRKKCANYSASARSLNLLNCNDHALGTCTFPRYDNYSRNQEFSFLIELTDFDGLVNEGQRMQGNSTPGYVSPQMIVAHTERNHNYRARQADDAWALGEVIKRLCKVILVPSGQPNSLYKFFVHPLIKDLQHHDPSLRITVSSAYYQLYSFYLKLIFVNNPSLNRNPCFSFRFSNDLEKNVASPARPTTVLEEDEIVRDTLALQCLCNNKHHSEFSIKNYSKCSRIIDNEVCDDMVKDSSFLSENNVCSTVFNACHNSQYKNFGQNLLKGFHNDQNNKCCLKLECLAQIKKIKSELKGSSLAISLSDYSNLKVQHDSDINLCTNIDVKCKNIEDQANFAVKSCNNSNNDYHIFLNEKLSQMIDSKCVANLNHLSSLKLSNFGNAMQNQLNNALLLQNDMGQLKLVSSRGKSITNENDEANMVLNNNIKEANYHYGEKVCFSAEDEIKKNCELLRRASLLDDEVECIKAPGAARIIVTNLTDLSNSMSSLPCAASDSLDCAASLPRCELLRLLAPKSMLNAEESTSDLGDYMLKIPLSTNCSEAMLMLYEESNKKASNKNNELDNQIAQLPRTTVDALLSPTPRTTKNKIITNSMSLGVGTISTTAEGSPCSSIVYNSTTITDLTSNNFYADVDQSLSCSLSYNMDNSTSGRHSETSVEEYSCKDFLPNKAKGLSTNLPKKRAIDRKIALLHNIEDDGSDCLNETLERISLDLESNVKSCNTIIGDSHSSLSKEEIPLINRIEPTGMLIASPKPRFSPTSIRTLSQRTVSLKRNALCSDNFAQVKSSKNITSQKNNGLNQNMLHCDYATNSIADALCFLQGSKGEKAAKPIVKENARRNKEKKGFVVKRRLDGSKKLHLPENATHHDNCGQLEGVVADRVEKFEECNKSKLTYTDKAEDNKKLFSNAWKFLSCDIKEKAGGSKKKVLRHMHTESSGNSFFASNFLLLGSSSKAKKIKEEPKCVKKPKFSAAKSKREPVSNKRSASKGNGVQSIIKSLARRIFGVL